MKQIAIIQEHKNNCSACDHYGTIAKSITEWTEVSDEDFKLLCNAALRGYNDFIVICRPDNEKEVILKTVADFIAREAKVQKEIEKEKRAKEEKKRLKSMAKTEKDKEKRKQLLEELKKEFREDNDEND